MKNDGIQHVIWDWNGTLLDDVPACVQAMNRMLQKRNLGSITVERYREIFGFPVKNYYRALGFDMAREDWDAVAREFHDHYAETSREMPLREGIAETLERLRERQVPMSVLSASETSILRRMLASKSIDRYFERVCGLADLHARSKLDLGRKMVADLALPAESVQLIGDTTHDYDVACDLGCRCALITGGHQAQHRLVQCRCRIIEKPEEIVRLLDEL